MAKRYRVLITISELIYSSQVRNLYDLLSLIDREKFDVEVGALATGDEAQADIERLGYKVYRLRLQPGREFSILNLFDMIKGPFIIAAKQYDVVHSLLYQSLPTEPLFFKLLTKTKYIYTKSNIEWDNHPKMWHWKSKLADRILSISNATDELLNEKGFGEKKEKIYLGIDTQQFTHDFEKRKAIREQNNVPQHAVVFGCAAQFVEWKEHLTALKAFEMLAVDNPDIYLFYCGPNHRDAYYDEVLSTIDACPYNERIKLLGSLSDMPAFYSSIDCFVLPSRYETFGYVYIEAMSCSLPAIACRAAGPLEIILEGVTGYFTEISNPENLAGQMSKYINERDLLKSHGEAARQRVIDIFSKETMARKTQQLYLASLGVES
jgi:glycosyltransferase involved in cell wall biosynthesis